jgi:biopolymer transport protein ExbD
MKVNIEPDELDVRIEIIPLIDIIFCILVFFLLGSVTTSKTEALNVDLPRASSGQTQFGDTLTVEVDVLGQIIIKNTVISKDQLSQLLAAYVAQKPEGVVVFQADKRLNYETVINLFDLLRKVGGTRVALGTTDKAATPQDLNLIPGLGMPPTAPNPLGQPNLNSPTLPNPSSGVPGTSGVPNNPVPNPTVGIPTQGLQGVPNSNSTGSPKRTTQGTQTLPQTPGTIP